MNRRKFMKSSAIGGLAVSGAAGLPQVLAADGRDYFEIRNYEFETQEQASAFESFLEKTGVPALNRAGINPVGVFVPEEGFSPVTILLRHKSVEALVSLTEKLVSDKQLASTDVFDAPAASPAYKRLESSLFVAFAGMPELEVPIKGEGRVFQLRIYESPSVKTGQKKIEMFNRGEIEIFRKTGLHPVFFGEALVGSKMPNLTYMLSFRSREEQKVNWKQFVSSPEWKELSAIPEYADKKILSDITNLLLKPSPSSQI
ncbi:MAG TPA: NIPSNAP family protein [Acidobacteriota bacterium]|nr:NIPSNAP family protein [Acidobacteriota bacterium]